MRQLEECLHRVEALLETGMAWTMPRRALATALRQHVLEITKLRLRTGYSPDLQAADMRLTEAITRFQFDKDDNTTDDLRLRLREYHRAVLDETFMHSPIPSLVEILGLNPIPDPAPRARAA